MPEARPDRIASFGIALTGHPSSHALPSGGGHELIYAAHPEATQVAGGRCRVRACSWAVHDSFEGASQPHLQRGPRDGLVDNQQNSLRPRCKAAHTCERTRAGRACEGHGERMGRRVWCSSTHAPLG